jgi:hypothetical protein
MSQSPQVIAARDQMQAACRDRFDRIGVDLYDDHDRLTILAVVGIIADSVLAYPNDTPDCERLRITAVGYVLEALVSLVEITE